MNLTALTLFSNPKDYNDNEDARKFDARLRGPVRDIELQVDMQTGMKNYIANGNGDWATSAAFVKFSFERSIHHGRLYTNGHGFFKGKDEDLAEALRCLGQGLHTLEDFGAHTNYVELVLRDMGFHNVFPHVGTATGINLHGKQTFPLVTGTFGMVDFYHSVLGEATDHFTQSEINEMDNALGTAQQAASSSNPLTTLVKLLSKVPGTKDLCDEAERLQSTSQAQARANEQGGYGGSSRGIDDNYGGSTRGADDWQNTRASHAGFPQSQGYDQWGGQQGHQQQQQNWGQPQDQWQGHGQQQNYNSQDQFPGAQHNWNQPAQQDWQQQQPQHQQQQNWQQPPSQQQSGQQQGGQQQQFTAPSGLEGMPNFDPAKTVSQIYPILVFRDKVVRTISSIIEKIPGLEALVDRITETLTVFILSLLAPFVRPVINAISKTLQTGSEGVINSSGKHQYEVWTDPHCSDPTHSMLSKDHFSNLLNEPAGSVAAEILKYIAPRVLYAWEHPDVPVQQVLQDVESIFHHPALRNERNEAHRNMYNAVKQWVDSRSDRGRGLEAVLSSEAVRAGKNHKGGINEHAHVQHHTAPAQHQSNTSGLGAFTSFIPGQHGGGGGGHQSSSGGLGALSSFLPGQQHGGGGHQSSSGGLGAFTSFIPGQQHGGGGGHSGQNSNPLGAVGNMLGSFTGGGGHQGGSQQHGGGGFGDVLNLAGKLPIPGASNLSKYGKMMGSFGGGGKRGLDDNDTGGYGGSELGGARELHEAAAHGSQYGGGLEPGAPPARSPSPMPMQPPAGYEQYGQGVGSYGQEGQNYQYQTSYQDPYQSQAQGQYDSNTGAGYGGQNQNYYR